MAFRADSHGIPPTYLFPVEAEVSLEVQDPEHYYFMVTTAK